MGINGVVTHTKASLGERRGAKGRGRKHSSWGAGRGLEAGWLGWETDPSALLLEVQRERSAKSWRESSLLLKGKREGGTPSRGRNVTSGLKLFGGRGKVLLHPSMVTPSTPPSTPSSLTQPRGGP